MGCKDEKSVVPPFQVSKEKAKSLGIDFLPLEVSLRDTVENLKEISKFLNRNIVMSNANGYDAMFFKVLCCKSDIIMYLLSEN
ncbi:unnamed protein product [Ilex paraguariensis]|uniref:Uncharacterized protein n=1 Tax=Ilex paraguariensis TaxID=185542 RepID=A0ABC8THF3_9AQUA